jgi:putative oxygen-independent coproporphyrinogen III oxidase
MRPAPPGPLMSAPLPPLSLYVHVPWCLRKCPYCDFNSHTLQTPVPEGPFVRALLADLARDAPLAHDRPLTSLFIGGGTPSLLSAEALTRLLTGIRDRLDWTADIEITLEANPGTAEARRFAGYRAAGVNRLSLGIQSLDNACLTRLGRIHDAAAARAAVASARTAGFDNLNLDLMFALPGQDLAGALADLDGALAMAPEHISYYQLTLEPHTAFFAAPPPLPDEDLAWAIQEAGQARLAAAGLRRYEVSAYARPDRRCRHNLNYWGFGDYLGIGPGAHSKLSDPGGRVRRRWKHRDPARYLDGAGRDVYLAGQHWLTPEERYQEFLLNALRLPEGFSLTAFETTTGLPAARLLSRTDRPRTLGLLAPGKDPVRPTPRGLDFLDDLLALLIS